MIHLGEENFDSVVRLSEMIRLVRNDTGRITFRAWN